MLTKKRKYVNEIQYTLKSRIVFNSCPPHLPRFSILLGMNKAGEQLWIREERQISNPLYWLLVRSHTIKRGAGVNSLSINYSKMIIPLIVAYEWRSYIYIFLFVFICMIMNNFVQMNFICEKCSFDVNIKKKSNLKTSDRLKS